jgi:hypothetical protein
MNTERLRHQGLLATAKEKRNILLPEINMLREGVREKLDAFTEPIDINIVDLRILMTRLEERLSELRAVQEQIDKLEESLYG